MSKYAKIFTKIKYKSVFFMDCVMKLIVYIYNTYNYNIGIRDRRPVKKKIYANARGIAHNLVTNSRSLQNNI